MLAAQKLYHSLFLAVVFSIVFSCGSEGSVNKAKEFMAAGMYPQAIELLNQRIHEKPTDAEAHFQLGVCYINTGNLSGADERFGSAVKLKADYGYKIGPEYKKAGSSAWKKGDVPSAQGLYFQAVKYQAGLKNDIGADLFAGGKNLFEQGQHKTAENHFMVAASINPDLKDTIADYYFQTGNKAEASIDFKTLCFDSAVKFSQKSEYLQAQTRHKDALAEDYYAKAQAIQPRPSGLMPQSERQELINQLSQKTALLQKACQYTNRYEAERMACYERWEMEKAVLSVIAEKGEPKFVKLTEKNKWVPICTIKEGGKVTYLSLHQFKERDNANKENTWKAAPREDTWYTVYGRPILNIEFCMLDKATIVYYW